MPRLGYRQPPEHREAIRNSALERTAPIREERAEAVKADIAAGDFTRRLDRIVRDGGDDLFGVFRILSFDPEEELQ